jgi:soluble lytic murein transglycosylase-like protein
MMRLKKIILIVLLILPIGINAQKKQFDWNPVMDAIIQVESKGNPKAFNKNGNCAGILQITPGLVKQCNIWLKAKKSKKRYTLADRYNVKKSKEMFVMIQSHYNKSNNVEKAIRIWNGGPGYTIKGTNGYLKKVMKYYKKGS